MCTPDVYMVRSGEKDVVFREVESLEVDGGEFVFRNLAGETFRTGAVLREINLVEHMIVLEDSGGS